MNKNLLRECLRLSLLHVDGHPQRTHYIHFSYAVVDGTVYVVGTNKAERPEKHFGYTQRVPEPKVHSELDAYRKLRKLVPISKTSWELINVRVNRSGEMRMARPCSVCQEWLRTLKCRGVTYTTELGWERWTTSTL